MAARGSDYVSLYDLFVTHIWWEYQSASLSSQIYHWLNLIEGLFWLALAGLVATRWRRHRHSQFELIYAAAFVTFGLSDFREAYRLESWLLLFKGANLVALLWLRNNVIKRWYPGSKTY